MKLKKNEINWLVQKLNEHLDGSLMSVDDIFFYYNKLPKHLLFEGTAYRVIYSKNHDNLNLSLNSNKCFSKRESALNLFIENQRFHNRSLPYKRYKAQIKGIDINSLVQFLKEKGYDIINKFSFEEEILVVEIDKMEEF